MIAREPSLVTPIICSVIAAVAFSIARINGMPDGPRGFFVFIGVVFALFAFVTGGDWLINRGIVYLRSAREAYYAPYTSFAREINAMSRDGLRALEAYTPLEGMGYLGTQGIRWVLHTSTVDIPYSFITDYLEDCEGRFPYFIPQHGMPDALRRDYVQAFTGLMVNQGHAEPPLGNRPAKWNKPLNEIGELLGITEL